MSTHNRADPQLEQALEQALLDAAAIEAAQLLSSGEGWDPSASYQAWEEKFLSAGRANGTRRPLKRFLRSAACFALVTVAGGGVLLGVSPQARANLLQWVRHSSASQVMYQFRGETGTGAFPIYEIQELPEGFDESERHVDADMELGMIRYENQEKEGVSFSWNAIRDGAALSLHTEGQTCTAVTVGGFDGELFETPGGGPCTVAWADEEAAVFFRLSSAALDSDALLDMAQSVAVSK